MKKILFTVMFCCTALMMQAQFTSTITNAQNFNDTVIVNNNTRQITAVKIHAALDSIIKAIRKAVDTAATVGGSGTNLANTQIYVGRGTGTPPRGNGDFVYDSANAFFNVGFDGNVIIQKNNNDYYFGDRDGISTQTYLKIRAAIKNFEIHADSATVHGKRILTVDDLVGGSADGNGIYTGDGTTPSNLNVTVPDSARITAGFYTAFNRAVFGTAGKNWDDYIMTVRAGYDGHRLMAFQGLQADTALSPTHKYGTFGFSLDDGETQEDGQNDLAMQWAYNPFNRNANENYLGLRMESHWIQTTPQMEFYLQTKRPGGTYTNRPFFYGIKKSDNTTIFLSEISGAEYRKVKKDDGLGIDTVIHSFDDRGIAYFGGDQAKFTIGQTSGTPNSFVVEPESGQTRVQGYVGQMNFKNPTGVTATETTTNTTLFQSSIGTGFNTLTPIYVTAGSANVAHSIVGSGTFTRSSIESSNPDGFPQLFLQNDRGGTTSYLSMLQGGSTASIISPFGLDLADGSFILAGGANNTKLAIGTQTAIPFYLGTNNAPQVTIADNGYVGIGTITPSVKLHLVGDFYSEGLSFMINLNDAGGNGHFRVGDVGNVYDSTMLQLQLGGWLTLDNRTHTSRFSINRKYGPNQELDVNGNAIISNHVGIGIYSPYVDLQIGDSTSSKKFAHYIGEDDKAFVIFNSTDAKPVVRIDGGSAGKYILFDENNAPYKIGIGTSTPTERFEVAGNAKAQGLILSYIGVGTTYSIQDNDHTIDCDGTFTVTLPTAVGITGKIYNIKNSGSGTITLATTSSQIIDGSTTVTINVQYTSITVQSTGTGWIIL